MLLWAFFSAVISGQMCDLLLKLVKPNQYNEMLVLYLIDLNLMLARVFKTYKKVQLVKS